MKTFKKIVNAILDAILGPKKKPMDSTSSPRVEWNRITVKPPQYPPYKVTDTTKITTTPEVLSFDTPKKAWRAVRVMCDRSGLTFTQKNILCACIYQESQFMNRYSDGRPVKGENWKRNADGSLYHANGRPVLLSTDWGICQVNDYWWIGVGKLYPSVPYVMNHPEEMVQWMINYMKSNGHLQRWSSYSTGAYKQWLPLQSPMWALAAK